MVPGRGQGRERRGRGNTHGSVRGNTTTADTCRRTRTGILIEIIAAQVEQTVGGRKRGRSNKIPGRGGRGRGRNDGKNRHGR